MCWTNLVFLGWTHLVHHPRTFLTCSWILFTNILLRISVSVFIKKKWFQCLANPRAIPARETNRLMVDTYLSFCSSRYVPQSHLQLFSRKPDVVSLFPLWPHAPQITKIFSLTSYLPNSSHYPSGHSPGKQARESGKSTEDLHCALLPSKSRLIPCPCFATEHQVHLPCPPPPLPMDSTDHPLLTSFLQLQKVPNMPENQVGCLHIFSLCPPGPIPQYHSQPWCRTPVAYFHAPLFLSSGDPQIFPF